MTTDPGTFALWVCTCCLFAREGDGCQDHECDREPWSQEPQTDVTHGRLHSEHECGMTQSERSESDCDCAVRPFSSSSCDGCGTPLAGERHAYTWWAHSTE